MAMCGWHSVTQGAEGFGDPSCTPMGVQQQHPAALGVGRVGVQEHGQPWSCGDVAGLGAPSCRKGLWGHRVSWGVRSWGAGMGCREDRASSRPGSNHRLDVHLLAVCFQVFIFPTELEK